MMDAVLFYFFAALALGSALVVVGQRNATYSAFALIVTLISLSVIFGVLGSPFIAALQVIVYAGAIMVLFLFVLMLLNISREEHQQEGQTVHRWLALLGAGAFVGLVVPLVYRATRVRSAGALSEEFVSVRELARDLFTRYLLQFEIVGLLLLVAVVAATVVARRPPAASDAATAADAGASEVEP